jgi:MFS family permease
MKLPKIYNTYFLAIVATIGGMLFGFDISSMAAIVGTDQYIWFFNNPHGVTQGAIGSALAAGSGFGAVIAGPISDTWGRKISIAFACVWWLIGTAVQVSTHGTMKTNLSKTLSVISRCGKNVKSHSLIRNKMDTRERKKLKFQILYCV